MPAIRIVMPDGATKSFPENTPKRVIRDAIEAAQAEMTARHGKKKFKLLVTQNTPTYEDYVTAPPPPGVGAANMPGLGDMLAGKAPPQLAPEAPKKTPVLFIGGFGDTWFGDPERTVKDYSTKFQQANPGTEVVYHSWDDKDGIDAWMKSQPKDSGALVFGQSYGADRAAYAVRTNPGVADKLYTIDGIGSINRAGRGMLWDKVRDGAGEWTSVSMKESPLRHLDYWWADTPATYSKQHVRMPDLEHANFFGAMGHLREQDKLPRGLDWNINP